MKFKVAVIDQGVDIHHNRLSKTELSGVNIHLAEDQSYYMQSSIEDDTGHGTSIAAIITKIIPEVGIFVIKLSSFKNRISEDLLCEGIEYALNQNDIRIINISMGIATDMPSSRLYGLCQRAYKEEKIIVAAAYNYPGFSCYPAHFESVYGVSTGLVSNKFEYKFQEGEINVFAKGTMQRVAVPGNKFKISSGTSLATAHFSGYLGKLLSENPSLVNSSIKKLVLKNSNPDVFPLLNIKQTKASNYLPKSKTELDLIGQDNFKSAQSINFAKNIALFPISEKEINTVVENLSHSTCNIESFIDFPIKLNKTINNNSISNSKQRVAELSMINFKRFDTIVIGYFLDQVVDLNLLFGIKLIKKCLELNKNFIIWDRDVKEFIEKESENFHSYTGQIKFIAVSPEMNNVINDFKVLPSLTTPVLAVIGTSNKQGKISAQLNIKRILSNSNYRVTHLSTEPQGILLGANYSFPYGHKSTVGLNEPDWSRFLKILLKCLQYYTPSDIILTGTQGGLIPRARTMNEDFGNDLSSLFFLLGVQPDVIACAINPMDSISLINDTIQVVNSYCKPKLLFYFMTPWIREFSQNIGDRKSLSNWKLMNPEEFEKIRYDYSIKLNAPVLDIMDKQNDSYILNAIQDALSS